MPALWPRGPRFSPRDPAFVRSFARSDKVLHVWDLRDFSLRLTVPVFEAIEGLQVRADDAACGSALRLAASLPMVLRCIR